MVMDAMGNGSPAVTVVVTTLQSKPDPTPTEPSSTVAPPDVSARNHAAVPLASAEASWVIAWAVATPAAAAENAGLANVQVASSVCVVTPVSAVAGWAPS